MAGPHRGTAIAVVLGALGGAAITAAAFLGIGSPASPAAQSASSPATPPASHDRAHRIHERGGDVMPFALEKTTHVFEMTDSGGIQDVVAEEPDDTATIRLIRQHLRHEAGLFQEGDFRDPGSLHGTDMPGLQALAGGVNRLRVDYRPLPDGARITFSARDPALVTAVHRCFGAQLSDHAADATYR